MTPPSQPPPDFYCTDWSLAVAEPMTGTAVFSKVWLFLEVDQPWSAKAVSDNQLPQPLQAWLAKQSEQVGGRLQFIKQPRGERQGWTFFVAVFAETASRIYRFDLSHYDELFSLDVPDIVASAGRYEAHLTSEPQLMVCTNGKRDVCCALHGVGLLRALAGQLGPAVWETTHLGGHRFAATLLTLPHGVNYGRLRPEETPTLLAHLQNDTLWLEKLRGRVRYDAMTQVAEAYLRQEFGEIRLGACHHVATLPLADGRWQVRFQTGNSVVHRVEIAAAQPLTTFPSSGNLKPKMVPQFSVISLQSYHPSSQATDGI